jgi:uncharacterized protein with HEPN domain
MSDDASRAWQFYIDDMIGFADKVIAYTNGMDWSIVTVDIPALLVRLHELKDSSQ